jgi:hypothetical protein
MAAIAPIPVRVNTKQFSPDCRHRPKIPKQHSSMGGAIGVSSNLSFTEKGNEAT